MGYMPDPEGTGMWVHSVCGKPNPVYLDTFYRRLQDTLERRDSELPE